MTVAMGLDLLHLALAKGQQRLGGRDEDVFGDIVPVSERTLRVLSQHGNVLVRQVVPAVLQRIVVSLLEIRVKASAVLAVLDAQTDDAGTSLGVSQLESRSIVEFLQILVRPGGSWRDPGGVRVLTHQIVRPWILAVRPQLRPIDLKNLHAQTSRLWDPVVDPIRRLCAVPHTDRVGGASLPEHALS